jgi:hypothetical protein
MPDAPGHGATTRALRLAVLASGCVACCVPAVPPAGHAAPVRRGTLDLAAFELFAAKEPSPSRMRSEVSKVGEGKGKSHLPATSHSDQRKHSGAKHGRT